MTSPNREVLRDRNETLVTGDESAETDAEAIEASLREPERFAVLYGRHHQMIHRYIARRLGRDQADDLMAETFLIAFGLGPIAVESASRIPDWRTPPPGGNFDTAFTILEVKVVDHLPPKT
jgi:hypothetical protein